MSDTLTDTAPEADAAQIALFRSASVARRAHLAFSLSATAITLARRAIRRGHPTLSEEDVSVRFVRLHYGDVLARDLKKYLDARPR